MLLRRRKSRVSRCWEFSGDDLQLFSCQSVRHQLCIRFSLYAKPIDQLAAAPLDHKDISMLYKLVYTEALSLPARSRARRAVDVDPHPVLLD